MSESNDSLARTLGRVREGELDAARLRRQKDHVLATLQARSWRPGFRVAMAAAGAAAVVVVAAGVGLRRASDIAPTVSCHDEAGRIVEAGRLLVSPATGTLQLSFSDQSEVELHAGAHARMEALGAHAVTLDLQDGRLSARVTPGQGIEWSFVAGPYRASVLGTVFSADWSENEGRLVVEVQRGRVRVEGGTFAQSPLVVEAGQRLEVTAEHSTLTQAPAGEAPPRSDNRRILQDSSAGGRRRQVPLAVASAPEPSRAMPTGHPTLPETISAASWREMARQGRFAAAIALVTDAEIEKVLTHGGAEDLLLLADTARFAEHRELAERTLDRLQVAFPRSPQAAEGLFLQGRLASEVGRTERAIECFERLATGQQGHPLAPGALGRLIGLYEQQADSRGARGAAQRYLDREPNGPYNELARVVLARGASH